MPSLRRVLAAGAVGGLLWGLVFGWIDGDLLTVGNWAYALGSAVVVVALVLVATRLETRRRR